MADTVIFLAVVLGIGVLLGSSLGRGNAAEPQVIIVNQQSEPAPFGCFPFILLAIALLFVFALVSSPPY